MARSRITQPTQDLVNDGGAVLFSFVQGEQIEYPIDLDTLTSNLSFYNLSAVVVEARNVALQTEKPTTIQTSGKRTNLTLRKTNYMGTWLSNRTYVPDDVVLYGDKHYSRLAALEDGQTPDLSTAWWPTAKNRTYLQIPSTLGSDWAVKPTAGYAVYGFVEIQVSERSGTFPRTWKPVRGMIELLYSPFSP